MHSSLKAGAKSKQHRSVLKRIERLMHLIKKDEWKEGDSVFGLPKIKIIKFKVKKEKVKEAEGVAAAGGETTTPVAEAQKTQAAPAEKKAAKPER